MMSTDPRYRALGLFDEWREEVWTRQSRELWLPVLLPDGTTGGTARTSRWGPGPSVYLSACRGKQLEKGIRVTPAEVR